MPHFWQIDPTRWINPAHIIYVEDNPDWDPPILYVTMITVESGWERHISDGVDGLSLEGEAREKLLAYLARETESAPPPALA